jgi:hypothetical protein
MFTPIRFVLYTLGLVGQDYAQTRFIAALRDLRELSQVAGFNPQLYGVDVDGIARRFQPGTRDWSAPVALP